MGEKDPNKKLIRDLTHRFIGSAQCNCEEILTYNQDIFRDQLRLIKFYEEILPLVEKKFRKIPLSEVQQITLDTASQTVIGQKSCINYWVGCKDNSSENLEALGKYLWETVQNKKLNNFEENSFLTVFIRYISQFFSPSCCENKQGPS